MKKILVTLLVISVLVLIFIHLTIHRFLGFYYVFLIGGVGSYIWKNRVSLEKKFVAWNIGGFKKFMTFGVAMILVEETFAGFFLNLGVHNDLMSFVKVILQCWALNIFALPGFMIAWYLLMRHYVYTRMEIFVLVGIFGLYSEKIYAQISTFPFIVPFLLLPTMVTYVVIIAPSVMSFREYGTIVLPKYIKYFLGLFIPFLCSVPLIGILSILLKFFPWMFPLEFVNINF